MISLEEDDVRNLSMPTLLVTGSESPTMFHRLTDRLEELIEKTVRVDIPNASHIMHEDNPVAYNHAVLKFLAS